MSPLTSAGPTFSSELPRIFEEFELQELFWHVNRETLDAAASVLLGPGLTGGQQLIRADCNVGVGQPGWLCVQVTGAVLASETKKNRD